MSLSFLNTNNENLLEVAKQNAEQYQTANPFPSISFNNFFNPEFLDTVLGEFPDLEAIKNAQKYADPNQVKFAGKGENYFGNETRKLMHFLNSQPFLEFLQVLTGIEEPLIGDPYFVGAGQHQIKKGGLLKIHADFNKHTTLKLDRRINVLVYLNKDWKEEYGGHFELWTTDMKECVKKISPIFNTMAIFSTTDYTYHGHPDPLNCPEGRSRKSLALYYYSNGRPASEVNKGLEEHNTLFKVRAGNNADILAHQKVTQSAGAKAIIKEITPPILFKAIKSVMGNRV